MVQKKAEEVSGTVVSERSPAGHALWWCGTLPALGIVKQKVASANYNREFDGYYEYVESTAEKLWNDRLRRWIGKCPGYQDISVRGFSFPAYSSKVERQNDEGDIALVPFPGQVFDLVDREAERIRKACYRYVIRRSAETDRPSLINLDQGEEPSDVDPKDELKRAMTPKTAYNKFTDNYIADSVYMVRLEDHPDGHPSTPKASWYRLVPTMDEFFRTPPKSVYEEDHAAKA